MRATLRRFLAGTSPVSAARRLMTTPLGHDPAVWRRMADELGLPGLAVPEEHGGAGGGVRDLAVVMEELGRSLVCGPFLASAVLAVHALLASGDERARRELLPGLAEGAVIGTLAVAEESGSWEPEAVTMTAGPGHRLDGVKSFVLDGHVAGLVLVAARTPAGLSLFAVDGDAPGLTRVPLPVLDRTRRLARLEFAGVPARLVGREGAGARAVAHALDVGAVALAAEQL
ncbi:MAG TPA: acyl-CoA dehydrogenase family protein, partial [Thermomonospora sp.]|nr:acyl-CoA dehydrogenase family protein [Thermomonospora sp.]